MAGFLRAASHGQWAFWDNVVAVCGAVLAAAAALGLVAWCRYLRHKETMRMLDLGGDARASLEARERWQARWGLLYGARLMLAGLFLFAAVLIWESYQTTPTTVWRELFLMAVLFVAVMGVVTFVGYSFWARQQQAAEGAVPSAEAKGRGMRAGILAGAATMVLGLATLVGVLLYVDMQRGQRPGGYVPLPAGQMAVIGGAAAFLLVMGLVTLVAYSRSSRRKPEQSAKGRSEKSEDSERGQ